jgi:hypothetical protein
LSRYATQDRQCMYNVTLGAFAFSTAAINNMNIKNVDEESQ